MHPHFSYHLLTGAKHHGDLYIIVKKLSYDVTVIYWTTSCHKDCKTTRVITLWRIGVTSLTTSVSTMRFLLEILSISKAIKSVFKSHMINRILHSWSFHIKFMKVAKGSFHKFHMT